jgi:hypothetical protein
LALRHGCGNPGRSASPAVQQFRSGTHACVKRSGWWFSTPRDAIRGCASIMNAFAPRANLAKWQSSQLCESCSHRFGAWLLTADPSLRAYLQLNPMSDVIYWVVSVFWSMSSPISRDSPWSAPDQAGNEVGESRSPSPIRRRSSARTRSETALTTSAPPCVGSIRAAYAPSVSTRGGAVN